MVNEGKQRRKTSLATNINWFLGPILKLAFAIGLILAIIIIVSYSFAFLTFLKNPLVIKGLLEGFSKDLPAPNNFLFAEQLTRRFLDSFQQILFTSYKELFSLMLLVWLISSIIHLIKAIVLRVQGIEKGRFDEITKKLDKINKLTITTGNVIFVLLVTVGMVSYFIFAIDDHKFYFMIAWIGLGTYLLIVSLARLKFLPKMSNDLPTGKRFLLINGAAISLGIILSINIIFLYVTSLPGFTKNSIRTFQATISIYGKTVAKELIDQKDIQRANENVKDMMTKIDQAKLMENIESILKEITWHIPRIMLLLWYFDLGSYYAAMRFKRPFLSFFIGLGLTSSISIGFNYYCSYVLRISPSALNDSLIIALSSISFMSYIGILLAPLKEEV